MIGILLITHGRFGESLLDNVCHILQHRPPLLAELGVMNQDEPLQLLPVARLLLKSVDAGDGVLVMTDIYGASPANLACQLMVPGLVVGVSGVNLPMLMRSLTYRHQHLEVVLDKAISGGREGILSMPKEC